jgi:hypothetical protein
MRARALGVIGRRYTIGKPPGSSPASLPTLSGSEVPPVDTQADELEVGPLYDGS